MRPRGALLGPFRLSDAATGGGHGLRPYASVQTLPEQSLLQAARGHSQVRPISGTMVVPAAPSAGAIRALEAMLKDVDDFGLPLRLQAVNSQLEDPRLGRYDLLHLLRSSTRLFHAFFIFFPFVCTSKRSRNVRDSAQARLRSPWRAGSHWPQGRPSVSP